MESFQNQLKYVSPFAQLGLLGAVRAAQTFKNQRKQAFLRVYGLRGRPRERRSRIRASLSPGGPNCQIFIHAFKNLEMRVNHAFSRLF